MLVRFVIKPSEAEIVALHSWKNLEIFLHSHKQTVKNLNSIFSCIFCVSEVAFSRHSIQLIIPLSCLSCMQSDCLRLPCHGC